MHASFHHSGPCLPLPPETGTAFFPQANDLKFSSCSVLGVVVVMLTATSPRGHPHQTLILPPLRRAFPQPGLAPHATLLVPQSFCCLNTTWSPAPLDLLYRKTLHEDIGRQKLESRPNYQNVKMPGPTPRSQLSAPLSDFLLDFQMPWCTCMCMYPCVWGRGMCTHVCVHVCAV